MLDFLDSDWFIIGMEVVFLLLITYDIKKYFATKKREYLVNIVLTIGFAIWTLAPFYTSYFEWTQEQKVEFLKECDTTEKKELCRCMDNAVFKTYSNREYMALDKNATEYREFMKESKEDCLDDSWF